MISPRTATLKLVAGCAAAVGCCLMPSVCIEASLLFTLVHALERGSQKTGDAITTPKWAEAWYELLWLIKVLWKVGHQLHIMEGYASSRRYDTELGILVDPVGTCSAPLGCRCCESIARRSMTAFYELKRYELSYFADQSVSVPAWQSLPLPLHSACEGPLSIKVPKFLLPGSFHGAGSATFQEPILAASIIDAAYISNCVWIAASLPQIIGAVWALLLPAKQPHGKHNLLLVCTLNLLWQKIPTRRTHVEDLLAVILAVSWCSCWEIWECQ